MCVQVNKKENIMRPHVLSKISVFDTRLPSVSPGSVVLVLQYL